MKSRPLDLRRPKRTGAKETEYAWQLLPVKTGELSGVFYELGMRRRLQRNKKDRIGVARCGRRLVIRKMARD